MLRGLRILIWLTVLFFVGSFAFQRIYALPDNSSVTASTSIPPSARTAMGAVVLPLAQANSGRSGISRLQDGHNAFAARLHLIGAAQHSVDLRYYIWQKDITGLLLLEALQNAAERGVRVRLLLDDNGTPDLDPELAEMNAHPNIEIRMFNPFVLRSARMLSYLFDFRRLNRRMHNKSITVDGVVTVVGGRNIGDIYFSRNLGVNYFDFDVVALGQAAADVAADFDLYWASPVAIPVNLILASPHPGGAVLQRSVAAARALPGGAAYAEAVANLPLMDELMDGARAFDWVEMDMVSDDPAKALGSAERDDLMIARLLDITGPPRRSMTLISAYFVPGDRLTGLLGNWARDGLQVRTLTNAQEATDVLPVHAGYRKYRGALVDAGVEVFELQSDQQKPDLLEQFGLVGSTNTSLHAKTFVIDRDEVFVGSFNFDPRSARLNTEMGFLVKSPDMAETLEAQFDTHLSQWAYKVTRAPTGGLQWSEQLDDGNNRIYTTEPRSTGVSRALVRFMGWLPIEWLL